MAGAIDLKAGSNALAGTNLFTVDKNPLNQLDQGLHNVIGKQANSAAGQVTSLIQGFLNGLLGFDLNGADGHAGFGDLSTYFGNLETFLGELNPLDPDFDPIAAAVTFIETVLNPTGLLADIVSLVQSLTGLSGGGLGLGDLTNWADNLRSFLPIGLNTAHGSFDPLAAAETFITDLLHPTNLLAPLSGGLLPVGVVPALPISLITGLADRLGGLLDLSTWQGLLDGVLGTSSGTGTTSQLQTFLSGLLPKATFQGIVDDVLGGSGNPFTEFVGFLTGTNSTATNASASATDALTQLSTLATGILGLGNSIPDLVGWLQDLFDTSQGSVSDITGLSGRFDSLITGVLGGGGDVSGLVAYIQNLLTPSSPINALNLFGLIHPGNLSLVGVSQIGDTSPNLLTNPNFQGSGALDGGGLWTQDSTVGYPPTAPLGAARTTANGTTKDLLSNGVAVTPDQQIEVDGYAQWASLTQNASTQPIQLSVNAYQAGSLVAQTTMASLAGTPATSSWQHLGGSYTVPAGVDTVRLVLHVTSDATGGTVWFTNLSLSKSGFLPTNLLKDLQSGNPLNTVLDDIRSSASDVVDQLTNFLHLDTWTSFLDLLGGTIGNAQNTLQGFLTGSSTLNANNIGLGTIADEFVPGVSQTIDNIVTNLLGLVGSGFSHAQANTALATTSANVVALQSSVASLQQAQTSGLAVADGFTNLTNWLLITNNSGGHWTTSGGVATWSANTLNSNTIDSINIWQGTGNNDKHSVGDYQVASLILSSTGGNLLGNTGSIDLWLRVADATTSFSNVTGIRFRWGADGSMSITRFVNGVSAVLNSAPAGTVVAPGTGVSLSCVAGKPGNARWFEMFINGVSKLSVPEVGSGSLLGAGYQDYAWGGRSEGQVLPVPGQQKPPDVNQWNGADQVAA